MKSTTPGWAWSTVEAVGDLRLGKQRSPKWHTGPNMRPYLRVANVFEDRIDLTDVKSMHFTPGVVENFELHPGDVLLNEGQTPELLGRPAIYKGELPGVCFTNSLIRFRPAQGVLSKWALIVFRHHMHSGRFQQESRITTNIAHLSLGRLLPVEFPVPPAAEQKRIVAAVEEQLSRLDAGVESLERARRNLRRMRRAVLQAAVEGRLVPQDRSDEPAELLLKRVLDGTSRPTPPGTVNLPDLPTGWVWTLAGVIGEVQGGIQKQPKRRPVNNAFPYLRVANVLRGALDLAEIHEIELFEGEPERYRLALGDLLVVEGNGSVDQIGRSALWLGDVDPCVHQNHIIRLRPTDVIEPSYLNAYWNSPGTIERLRAVASSTSGLYTLSTQKVRAVPVPLPPLAEQRRIVAEVDRQLSVVDSIGTTISAELRRADGLRQSILSSAFEGKLVQQDPSDEPASALLERIGAAQASSASRTRRRRSESA